MGTLNFSYRMELIFSQPVSKHQFTLRMLPGTDERQQVESCKIEISPECVLCEGEDTFGNRYVYGEVEHTHEVFCVEVSGKVTVYSERLIPLKEESELSGYRYPSRYTKIGDKLREYYNSYPYRQGEDKVSYATGLLHKLYQDIEYKQGVTDIHTTAEEALTGGQGVCQDYAHIMIALCRMADIPARYVVGMMQGEGYSHAWVEVFANGYWYGMDPTNDRLVNDTYVKISHGRDYQDCIVNRGVFRGMGTQTQKVRVVVHSCR